MGDEKNDKAIRSGTAGGLCYAGAEMRLFDGDELLGLRSLRSNIFGGYQAHERQNHNTAEDLRIEMDILFLLEIPTQGDRDINQVTEIQNR